MRAFKIVLIVVASLAALYAAICIYPTPLLWLMADRDPAILDGHLEQPVAFEDNILPAVLRHHPDVATEPGLLDELVREGAKIDRARRTAEIHWYSTYCENWLYLDWAVAPSGAVRTLQKDWQTGCMERDAVAPAPNPR